MSVRVDGQGRYFVDTRWPDGRRTRRYTPDQETAERINKKIEVAVVDEDRIWRKLRKDLRLEHNHIVSFSDLADQYFNQYVKSYNRDRRVKKSRLDVLKIFFKTQSLETMGPRSVALFIAFKRKNGAKNATVNRYLAVLRHMMSWAVGQGILESNPLGTIERLKESEWIGARPDESVIDDIFSRIPDPHLPVYTFIRETGCRRGEAIGLTASQIDFARKIVTFHGDTKSGKSRQVPLTDRALWAVQAMPKYGSTVFYHPKHLKPYTGDNLGWVWDKAAGESALRIHDLRHAYAIGLAEDGCPMHFISEVMGHHSVDFTRKRYARFSPESASRAVLRVLQGRRAAGAISGQ